VHARDPIAMAHNDSSPLENMHAALLFEILREEKTNIIKTLSKEDWWTFRKQVIYIILNTDMINHQNHLKELGILYELHGEAIGEYLNPTKSGCPKVEFLQDTEMLLNLQATIVHAGDLSNPVKPNLVNQQWVERVCEEFFAQGDAQKEMGLPVSGMCDRDVTEIPKMQMGFIDFVIAPFFKELFKLFPEDLKPLAINLKMNYEFYAHKYMSEHQEFTQAERNAISDGIVKLDDSLSKIFGTPHWKHCLSETSLSYENPKPESDNSLQELSLST